MTTCYPTCWYGITIYDAHEVGYICYPFGSPRGHGLDLISWESWSRTSRGRGGSQMPSQITIYVFSTYLTYIGIIGIIGVSGITCALHGRTPPQGGVTPWCRYNPTIPNIPNITDITPKGRFTTHHREWVLQDLVGTHPLVVTCIYTTLTYHMVSGPRDDPNLLNTWFTISWGPEVVKIWGGPDPDSWVAHLV